MKKATTYRLDDVTLSLIKLIKQNESITATKVLETAVKHYSECKFLDSNTILFKDFSLGD